MPSPHPTLLPAPPDPIELLGPGWTRRSSPRVEPLPDGGGRIVEIARRRGCRALLREAGVGATPLDHAGRRSLLRRIEAEPGSVVLFCTDPAHSHFIVCRTVRTGAVVRYEERRVPPRTAGTLVAPIERGGAPGAGPGTDSGGAVLGVIAAALAPGRGGAGGPARLQGLVDGIADLETPAALRVVWRALSRIQILDPRCADGGGLLSAARVLEPLWLATLDRMRSLIDDEDSRSTRRRPEFLADLRRTIALADDPRRHRTPDQFVRRLTVQRNLFAVACGPGGEPVTRLASYAELDGTVIPFLDHNVQTPAEVGGEAFDWRGRGTASPRTGRHGGEPRDEALDLALFAADRLRAHRLRRDRPEGELARAGAQLLERARMAAWGAGAPAGARFAATFLQRAGRPLILDAGRSAG